jgi:hypothetical protein
MFWRRRRHPVGAVRYVFLQCLPPLRPPILRFVALPSVAQRPSPPTVSPHLLSPPFLPTPASPAGGGLCGGGGGAGRQPGEADSQAVRASRVRERQEHTQEHALEHSSGRERGEGDDGGTSCVDGRLRGVSGQGAPRPAGVTLHLGERVHPQQPRRLGLLSLASMRQGCLYYSCALHNV